MSSQIFKQAQFVSAFVIMMATVEIVIFSLHLP